MPYTSAHAEYRWRSLTTGAARRPTFTVEKSPGGNGGIMYRRLDREGAHRRSREFGVVFRRLCDVQQPIEANAASRAGPSPPEARSSEPRDRDCHGARRTPTIDGAACCCGHRHCRPRRRRAGKARGDRMGGMGNSPWSKSYGGLAAEAFPGQPRFGAPEDRPGSIARVA